MNQYPSYPPRIEVASPVITKPAMAIMLLFSLCAFFLILTPILTGLIARLGIKADAVLRIAMVMQDVLVFIIPALITAMVATRLPARLLGIDSFPRISTMVLALVTLICSVPVMNAVIDWNQSLRLPASLCEVENVMRQLEENAKAVTDSLMAGASIPSLLLSVLIVGVFAGFSEELFFRGAMQRILISTKLNVQLAVWIVAFVFSLFHFQFFGFVPRLLLGAYFGYLLVWSRSLWLPVLVHVFNNSIVVISSWRIANNPDTVAVDIDKIGTDVSSSQGVFLLVLSAALTVVGIIATQKSCR